MNKDQSFDPFLRDIRSGKKEVLAEEHKAVFSTYMRLPRREQQTIDRQIENIQKTMGPSTTRIMALEIILKLYMFAKAKPAAANYIIKRRRK